MRRVIHAITPGDHYSPRTGSAIPTVVHGLASAARRDTGGEAYTHLVAVESGTYTPRYDSAVPIEFPHVDAPSTRARLAETGLARLGAPRWATARYFRPQAQALLREAPATVLAHNAPVLPSLLRGSQHRVVLYAHNDVLGTMTRAEAGRALGDVAAIVSVSDSLAEQLRAHLPRSLAARTHVVGNGVDCLAFSPAERPGTGRLRVIYVGRMIPQKGADVLVKAARLLDRDDLELVLVGSRGFDPHAALSPYEQRLRTLAAGSRVPVSFLPFEPRATLPELLRGADIMVVPSRWKEPSGLTIGEGLASGLPVIAPAVGGIPEVIGSAGVAVRSDDPADLARAIAALADDRGRRREISALARTRAESHDWSWSWAQLKSVLESL